MCISTISSDPSPTTSQKPSTTAGNSISTLSPTQPKIITNCNKFYFIKKGDTCATITSANRLSQTQFRNYNPSINTNCTGLWLDAYVCVERISSTPDTPTTTMVTTTKSGNDITTPTPIQDGMISNYNKFEFVSTTTTCQSILNKYRLTLTQFTK
jgi:hypothetical protein